MGHLVHVLRMNGSEEILVVNLNSYCIFKVFFYFRLQNNFIIFK